MTMQHLRGQILKVGALCLAVLILLSGHSDVSFAAFADPDGGFDVAVVEHLRIQVPSEGRQAWLEAERGSWEPWLARQEGFIGRDLLWDPETEEGTLLIRWRSREAWKAIAEQEVEAVQERFEQLARQSTGQKEGNPFPLVFEGELLPP
jgi:uncharacterized protein (TIGR03792 family)